jgi:hypothetical protein
MVLDGSLYDELIDFQLRQCRVLPLNPCEWVHPIFVILDLVSNIISICPATITLLIIGFTLCLQFTVSKLNASTTIAVDSVRFINDRIVSVKVE